MPVRASLVALAIVCLGAVTAHLQTPAALDAPRPIEAGTSLWTEELTWMEVRDAVRAGQTTVIVGTGGVEQNGPYLAGGKHNFVLQTVLPEIAKAIGNTLIAPVVKFVPEGAIEPVPRGHMAYPGTISLEAATFEALLTDICRSYKAHGFIDIILVGDSGGNQRGMENVANALNKKWEAEAARVHYLREYYTEDQWSYDFLKSKGIVQIDKSAQSGQAADRRTDTRNGMHDDIYYEAQAAVQDPALIRMTERQKAGLFSLHGVDLAPIERTITLGRELAVYRAGITARAFEASKKRLRGPGDEEPEAAWPAWRGPLGTGEASDADPLVQWSETTNVKWKTPIPGAGASTPIIWGDTIYLQTATPIGEEKLPKQTSFAFAEQRDVYKGLAYFRAKTDYQFAVVAVARGTGAIRWRKVLREEQPAEGRHPTNTFASGSPSTDGEHLIAFFGSRGLYALDMQGNLIWERDFGDMNTRNGWGEGSSPTLFRDKVIVTWDHEDASFIATLDKRTGRELWRRERDEPTTWATPLVVPVGDRVQVITNGQQHVRGYDLETGADIWHGPGLTFNSIPSPVAADGVAFLTSGFQGNVLLAVDLLKARGNIEESGALVWRRDRDTPYVASPLLYDGSLYVFKHLQGILTALDPSTGAVRYGPVRLDELPDVYASPVAAAGRIYVAGRDGQVVVFRHGPTFERLAVNHLDDGFDASPAIVGDELYLRGRKALYRISR